MTSIERFKETKLPPKEAFYSKLNDSHISDEGYDHAKRVWKEFGVKTMVEYHDLYLRSDVLLLAKNSEKSVFKITISIQLGITPLLVWLGMPL